MNKVKSKVKPKTDEWSEWYKTVGYEGNPLDKQFALPGYLKKQVQDLTTQKLLSTYFRVKEDITSQGIDGQAVNTQPTA